MGRDDSDASDVSRAQHGSPAVIGSEHSDVPQDVTSDEENHREEERVEIDINGEIDEETWENLTDIEQDQIRQENTDDWIDEALRAEEPLTKDDDAYLKEYIEKLK